MEPDNDLADAFARSERVRRRRRARLIGAVAVVAVALLAGLWWWAQRPEPPPRLPPVARPYLWKVSGGGGAPSYLFGTIHVGYRLSDLPPGVLAAQDRATATVVESDLLAPAPPAPPRAPDPARLSSAQWRRMAARTGAPTDELTTWPTSQLLGALLTTALPPVPGMDRELQRRAVERGQPVIILEERSFDEVTAAPEAAVDPPQVLAAVRATIDHPVALRRAVFGLAAHYAAGGDGACVGDDFEQLVGQLNLRWGPRIDAELRAGGRFVAIGCAHLSGDPSIVAYLRVRGFTVTRVDGP